MINAGKIILEEKQAKVVQVYQASYATLNKEEYMDMVKMFKQHQNVYENKNKYKSIKIQNDDKSWRKVYKKINEFNESIMNEEEYKNLLTNNPKI
ncbi:unnamed protein product [Rhizophagus irregularis]|nr:unnamed protein product [Rhizophagus irregularis]